MTTPKGYFTVSFHHAEQRLNISVVADKILVQGSAEYGGSLVFLSVLGPHSAVRGILAAAATRREIRCDAWPSARLHAGEGGRILTQFLAKDVTHGIFLGPEFFSAEEGSHAVLDPTPEKVMETVQRAYPVTTLPEWTDWLHQALKKGRQIEPLLGRGVAGCLVTAREETIDQIISGGVKNGAIYF